MARSPELLIFIVISTETTRLRKRKAIQPKQHGIWTGFSAFTDACMMAQNVVIAAESMGLGTVYAAILNDSEKICELEAS